MNNTESKCTGLLTLRFLFPPNAYCWNTFFMVHWIQGCETSVQFSCSVLSHSLWFMDCSTPGFPVHCQLEEPAQKFMSIKSVILSNDLNLCCPFLLLLSIFPSIRVFSSESVLRFRWPKYWSFRFRISPSNEYSRLISFRIDWLDLLVVQGTLKSLLQHHSSKASIL